MAEGKEIVIRIINEGGSIDGNDTEQKKVDVTGEKDKKSSDAVETAFMTSVIKKAYNQAKGIVIGEAKYQISKYFQLTDNYLGEQDLNVALNVIGKVWEVGLSIYAGIKIGKKYGPAGAIAATAIAVGATVVNTAMQVAHNYEQERIQLNQMNAQLEFNRQRAGYALTAGSIGENR